jgi:hypothetical protein
VIHSSKLRLDNKTLIHGTELEKLINEISELEKLRWEDARCQAWLRKGLRFLKNKFGVTFDRRFPRLYRLGADQQPRVKGLCYKNLLLNFLQNPKFSTFPFVLLKIDCNKSSLFTFSCLRGLRILEYLKNSLHSINRALIYLSHKDTVARNGFVVMIRHSSSYGYGTTETDFFISILV